MSTISLGIGTSHSPMLSTPYELFSSHEERDRALLGRETFEQLARTRGDVLDDELAPAVTSRRHEESQAAIEAVADVLERHDPDIVVIVGDDQSEWYSANCTPAISVFWGNEVNSNPPSLESVKPGLRASYWGYYGSGENVTHPVAAELAYALISGLSSRGFDLHQTAIQPADRPFGHAWGFVYERLFRHRKTPIVPVMINTYYPPNQPTPARCWDLGQAIRDVISEWPDDIRVAVIGSGGLSHFVVDEQTDRDLLDSLAQGDRDCIASIPLERLESGSSEARNWIAAGGACDHLTMRVISYIPFYRSKAGSGIGLAFAVWE